MSITSTHTHRVEDGIDTYSFQTKIRQTSYRHLVESVDGGPWQVWPLDTEGALDVETARAYVREINALIEFAEKLNQSAVRRRTEPGAPSLEEGI